MSNLSNFFNRIKDAFKVLTGKAYVGEFPSLENKPITLGKNTKASESYECAIGKYNYPMKKLLFSIGNGYSEDNRRNSVAIISDRPAMYVWGIGEYDGQDTSKAFDLRTVLSDVYLQYTSYSEPCSKKELARKLHISEPCIDLLLHGGVRSIRFNYGGGTYTFPYAGGVVEGDEVDTYAIYELTATASSFIDAPCYGTFVIHKHDSGDYSCQFNVDKFC